MNKKRYALLVRRNKIHANKPLDKWQFGILKDCTNKARKVLVAPCAMVTSILGHLTVVFATIRTNNVLAVTNTPTCLSDCLFALFI